MAPLSQVSIKSPAMAANNSRPMSKATTIVLPFIPILLSKKVSPEIGVDEPQHIVNGNGKTYSGILIIGLIAGHVDTDRLSPDVDQGAAVVALIDGRICLNHIRISYAIDAKFAIVTAHNPHCHGPAKAKRAPNGEDKVTHFY